MDRKTIVSFEEFRQLARPTSTHIDESEVMTYIRECEDERIIPVLGWRNFKAAANMVNTWGGTFDDTFSPNIFLDGGEWSENIVDADGKKSMQQHYTNGVKKAISYFVYAKLLRADGTIISRSGAMRHRSDESDHVDDGKLRQYNDTMSLAEMYLSECLLYLRKHMKQNIPSVRATRARVHAIGS